MVRVAAFYYTFCPVEETVLAHIFCYPAAGKPEVPDNIFFPVPGTGDRISFCPAEEPGLLFSPVVALMTQDCFVVAEPALPVYSVQVDWLPAAAWKHLP